MRGETVNVNISDVVNICYFAALIYMFCYVEVLPFSSKRIKYIAVYGTVGLIAVNLVLVLMFPGIPFAQMTLFTQSIPSLVLCWIIARHRDMRFIFVFCSIDVMSFMLLLIANSLSVMFEFGETMHSMLGLLFMIPMIILFSRYGKTFGDIVNRVTGNWVLLSVFVLAVYGYSYFIILYPEPLEQRLEMAPVIMGYAFLILISYLVIIKAVINKSRLMDMEKEELRLQLALEMKNRELEEKKSRILINQVQPHFIYNVLMAIRSLIKKEPKTAYDMVYDFSKYLRSNIDSLTESRYIPWKYELDHIDAYVRIEKARFGERLDVIYEIEEEDFYIPPLTVEPLVENAIKHGISPKIEGGTVRICSEKVAGGGYSITVEDDGVGFDVEKLDAEKSIGLNYIRTQMSMMPGAYMKLESKPGYGTKACVVFKDPVGDGTDEDHNS